MLHAYETNTDVLIVPVPVFVRRRLHSGRVREDHLGYAEGALDLVLRIKAEQPTTTDDSADGKCPTGRGGSMGHHYNWKCAIRWH